MTRKTAKPTTALALPAETAAAMAATQADLEASRPLFLAATVETDIDYSDADVLLSAFARQQDTLIQMERKATDPLKASMTTIRGWFKPSREIIAECMAHLKSQMSAYLRVKEQIRAEAPPMLAAALTDGDATTAIEVAELVAEANTTPDARATVTHFWRVERVIRDMLRDEDLVPDYDKFHRLAKEAGSGEVGPVVPGVVFVRDVRLGARR